MSTWEDGWAEYGYDNASHEEQLMFKLGWLAGRERLREERKDWVTEAQRLSKPEMTVLVEVGDFLESRDLSYTASGTTFVCSRWAGLAPIGVEVREGGKLWDVTHDKEILYTDIDYRSVKNWVTP